MTRNHRIFKYPGNQANRQLTCSNYFFQKELFGSKVEGSDSGRERKMSTSSTGSMKSKWMKAFKSLKTPPTNGTTAKEVDK